MQHDIFHDIPPIHLSLVPAKFPITGCMIILFQQSRITISLREEKKITPAMEQPAVDAVTKDRYCREKTLVQLGL